MGALNLSKAIETRRIKNAVVAGTTDQICSVVDTEGYESVLFTALFGALTANQVTKLACYGAAASDGSDSFSLLGTAVGPMADADSNKTLQLEVIRPAQRYLVLFIDRGTANAVIDGAIAQLSGCRKYPVSQGSTNSAIGTVQSPVSGTP